MGGRAGRSLTIAALVLGACSGVTAAEDLLECGPDETVDSAVVIAEGPDVAELAKFAFTQSLGAEPDDIEIEGEFLVAVVDDRRIAVTEPTRSEDTYTIDQVTVCRPK